MATKYSCWEISIHLSVVFIVFNCKNYKHIQPWPFLYMGVLVYVGLVGHISHKLQCESRNFGFSTIMFWGTSPHYATSHEKKTCHPMIWSGWWLSLPLWKISKSVGMMTFPIYGKKIMFLSTNQWLVFRCIPTNSGYDPQWTSTVVPGPFFYIYNLTTLW